MRLRWVWAVVLILLLTGTASAREVLQGDQCTLEADTVIDGDLFVLCRSLTVNGTVDGNIIGAAYTAEINGHVEDSVYLLAGQLDVRGSIGENLNFAGPVLQVHPAATFEADRGDLIGLTLSTTIFDGVVIPGGITSVSYQLIIRGDVGRDVSFWGSALTIGGAITRDVDATVGDPSTNDASQLQTLLIPFPFEVRLINPGLIVTDSASIGGQLTYTSPAVGEIAGQLANEPIFDPIITRPDFTQIDLSQETNAVWFGGYLSDVFREFVTLALVGLVGLTLMPRLMQSPLHNLRWRPFSSLGVGILTFFMSFVVLFVILLVVLLAIFVSLLLRLNDLAIIGAMALGVLNIGGASAFYFIAIYVSRVIVCLALGRLIVLATIGSNSKARTIYFSLLLGVAILAVLVWIPVIGWLFNALTLGLGLGALFLTFTQSELRARAMPQAAPVLPTHPEIAREMPPPPIIDDSPPGPGMENLPDGFKWWEDKN